MPIPSFGSVQIFGICWHVSNDIAERDAQQNVYAGLSGVEHIDMGGRGRMSVVRGILTGATLGDFVAAKTVLESFNDGVPRIFYDSTGFGWQNVILKAPKIEPYKPNGGLGFWAHFEVSLQHLSAT